MRSRLLWKLVGVHALTIGLVILTVWLVIDYLAADYFVDLGREYGVAPEALHRMFLDSAHRGLVRAGCAALVVAGGLSFALTRRTLRPLFRMRAIADAVAAGGHPGRVTDLPADEVGQLGRAFNRMADGLERTERLRKSLVSDVAHELRSPLTNMRGFLEGLIDGVVPAGPAAFASLHEETLRLARLVEDLLELSRADAARITLRPAVIQLDELAAQAIDLFRPRFAAKGVAVGTDLAAAGEVRADPALVARVLVNLLENAWRYTPPGGSVRLTADRPPGRVRVAVANTGEGIAPADLPRVFERFFRGEKSRSREYGGAGIGLAVVKELVEAHGGEVQADSTPEVTRVAFALPA